MPGPSNHPNALAPSRRVFIALWPGPVVVRALFARARQAHALCGGRVMRPDTLHLTLAFLGEVDADRVTALGRMLEAWTPSGGELILDHYGRFKGPRIVWAGPSEPRPGWLDVMHDALWVRLSGLGFVPMTEPFRAHVSLLRKAGPGDLSALNAQGPIVWRPRRCVLVASTPRETGSYYEVLAESAVLN